MRRKEIKIKVMGLAGSGKSLIAHIIREALSDSGIHGVMIDDEAPRERNFSENLIAAHGHEFDVEIETVQLKRDVWGERYKQFEKITYEPTTIRRI